MEGLDTALGFLGKLRWRGLIPVGFVFGISGSLAWHWKVNSTMEQQKHTTQKKIKISLRPSFGCSGSGCHGKRTALRHSVQVLRQEVCQEIQRLDFVAKHQDPSPVRRALVLTLRYSQLLVFGPDLAATQRDTLRRSQAKHDCG